MTSNRVWMDFPGPESIELQIQIKHYAHKNNTFSILFSHKLDLFLLTYLWGGGAVYLLWWNNNFKNAFTRKTWENTPFFQGFAPCMVNWRDTLIVFGGDYEQYTVQRYNISSGMWNHRNVFGYRYWWSKWRSLQNVFHIFTFNFNILKSTNDKLNQIRWAFVNTSIILSVILFIILSVNVSLNFAVTSGYISL